MKKIFKTIVGLTLGFAMAVGVGIGVANSSRMVTELNAAKGDSVTGGDMSNGVTSGWTTSGTGTYSGNGIKFDSANDYIQSPDISGNSLKEVKIGFKAGHNGGQGSVLTFATYNASGTVIDSDTFVPTEAYTSQSTVNNVELSGSVVIKYVRVTMTSKTKNLGMKYCEVFDNTSNAGQTTHKLTYAVGDHGTYDGSTPKAFDLIETTGTQTVKSLSDVGMTANTGYIFTGWNTAANGSGESYAVGSTFTMGTADATLTAQYEAGVALSYNGNGATSGSVTTTYVVSGGTQTVADNGFVAPSGKQFKEWNTLSTGLGTPYNPGDEITNFTSPLELFAIWEDSTSVTFDATSDTGVGSIVKSDITMTSSNGTLNNGTEYRFFKSSTLTFERSSGKIGSIEFTGVSGNPISNFTLTSGGGSLSTNGNNGTWEGAATSVTFTASVAQARATKIVVNYYTSADVTLNKSSLTLIVGGSDSTVAVSETSGITNPTYEWERTSGDDCVTLTNTATDTVTVAPNGTTFATCVLTLTVNGDNLQSSIVREVPVAVARISDSANPYNITEAKKAIDWNSNTYLQGAYVTGIISQIDSFDSSHNSITYWISNDGTTTDQFEIYSGKNTGGADFSATTDIEIGASVVVTGQLQKYSTTYQFNYNNEIVTYVAPTRVLSSIELSGDYPTEFITGDAFSHSGMVVTAHYDNGSTRNVTAEAIFSGYNMSTAGEQEVTVSYSENEVTKTATYSITLTYVARTSYILYQQSVLTEGDYIVVYEDVAMNTTIDSDRAQYTAVSPQNGAVLVNDSYTNIVWHIEKVGDYYTIYNADANGYLASTGAKNKAQILADGTDDKALWSVQYTAGKYEFVNKQNTINEVNATLRRNGTYGFACYATNTGGPLSLYKRDLKSYSYLETATSVETLYAKETAGGGQIEEGSVTMRFGITMPKASWDAINECYPITDYGVMCLRRTTLNSYEGSNTVEQAFRNPAQNVTNFNRGNGDTPYEDGDNYRFYVRIGNISEANYDTSIVVAPYILADGQYYFFTEMEESVRSLATKYYNDNTLQIALSNAALRNLAGISE